MTRLVPMPEPAFQHYLEQSITEYAQDHIKGSGWHSEEALRYATEEHP